MIVSRHRVVRWPSSHLGLNCVKGALAGAVDPAACAVVRRPAPRLHSGIRRRGGDPDMSQN